MYKRVLLKLSGEQLAGDLDGGIDTSRCAWLADEVRGAAESGAQVVIMVGGGNFVRGVQLLAKSDGIGHVTADNIGMLSTVMNAIALADVFNAHDVPTRALSSIVAEQVADPFTHRRAISHLAKHRVVIVGGGIGRPYLTTDTAAVSLALELECEVVLKATKVDGIYDKDPAKHDDAVRFNAIKFERAVSDDAIRVMDKAAMALAMDHSLPVVVFDALQSGNISRAVRGESIGTTIEV